MKSSKRMLRNAAAMGRHVGLGLAVSLAAGAVHAYEPGQIVVRAGIATVDPQDDSDAIVIPTDPATVLPNGVSVDSDTQLGLTLTYMLADHLGIAATHFHHTIELEDAPVTAGTAKQLPPTVSLQYYPLDANSKVQPYLGAGLNYTTFFSEDVDSELNTTLASVLGAPSVDADLSLKDSWGLALEAGVDYQLDQHWSINAAVWWVDIDTEATVSVGATDVKFDVEIDPWVYMVGAAYAF
jgi:outer membrane protein